MVKRNPVRVLRPTPYIICAHTAKANYYWDGEAFTSNRYSAKVFKTSSGALTIAKELLKRVNHKVFSLEVVKL